MRPRRRYGVRERKKSEAAWLGPKGGGPGGGIRLDGNE